MIPEPKVDIEKAASEIMEYMLKNKENHVDYGYSAIEMWPDPTSPTYPELSSFAAQWEALFVYADSVTGDNGENFPNEMVKRFEAEAQKIQDKVNNSTEFWSELRAAILPLYAPPPGNTSTEAKKRYEYWEGRWNGIKFWYDPIGTEVKTSKLMRAKNDDGTAGEIRSRELIRERVIPPGFVIQVL